MVENFRPGTATVVIIEDPPEATFVYDFDDPSAMGFTLPVPGAASVAATNNDGGEVLDARRIMVNNMGIHEGKTTWNAANFQ